MIDAVDIDQAGGNGIFLSNHAWRYCNFEVVLGFSRVFLNIYHLTRTVRYTPLSAHALFDADWCLQSGVMSNSFVFRTTISGSTISHAGDSGIVLAGSTQLMNGTKNTYPAYTNITGNLVFENGFCKWRGTFISALL